MSIEDEKKLLSGIDAMWGALDALSELASELADSKDARVLRLNDCMDKAQEEIADLVSK